MNKSDLMVSVTQIWLASLYAIGFLLLLGFLILNGAKLDQGSRDIVLSMIGVLGTLATQQSSYFFARQRQTTPDTPPAPVTDLSAQVKPGGFK